MTDKEYIWGTLLSVIGNEFGVAGVMGNLYWESGLCPYRLQGDFSEGYADSKEYTRKVDTGVISKEDFVHNGPNGGGYGLAQWTYYTRKQMMYEMKQSGGYSSIGSLELACALLIYELKYVNDFKGVLPVLQNASSIREASDKFLHVFENPGIQDEGVERTRANTGIEYYNELSGKPPIEPDTPFDPDAPDNPDDPDEPETKYTPIKKKHYNFILFNNRRKQRWNTRNFWR